MSSPGVGMLLDRGLTVPQLDLALRVAREDSDLATNRKRLTLALRDLVSDQEAEGKTKKGLTRVWLHPPEPAELMIAWARDGDWALAAARAVHLGALLATFPFVGVVARSVGQRFAADGYAEAREVRSDVRRRVGDRSAVDVAARKAYTTLANLGAIEKSGQVLKPSSDATVPAALSAWMAHAVILTRQAEALPISSVSGAPELLGWRIGPIDASGYALLTEHAATSGSILVASQ